MIMQRKCLLTISCRLAKDAFLSSQSQDKSEKFSKFYQGAEGEYCTLVSHRTLVCCPLVKFIAGIAEYIFLKMFFLILIMSVRTFPLQSIIVSVNDLSMYKMS